MKCATRGNSYEILRLFCTGRLAVILSLTQNSRPEIEDRREPCSLAKIWWSNRYDELLVLISYLKSDQSWISTEETNAKNMDFTPSKPKLCTPCKRCFLVVKSQFSVTSSLLKIPCMDKIGSRPRRILCVEKIAARPRGKSRLRPYPIWKSINEDFSKKK